MLLRALPRPASCGRVNRTPGVVFRASMSPGALGCSDDRTEVRVPPGSTQEFGVQEGADWLEMILDRDPRLTIARQHVAEAFERLYVSRILARHNNNVAHAARAAAVDQRYFRRLVARHRINR